MNHYQVGAVALPTKPSRHALDTATDTAIAVMAKSESKFFGFAIKSLDDGMLMNEYKASDNQSLISDWYGEVSSGNEPSVVFATYYDTDDPSRPLEKYLGMIRVSESRQKLWPWIVGGIGALFGLVIAGRKRKGTS